MKNKTVKALAIAMTVATVTMMGSASIYASDDTAETATEETADDAETYRHHDRHGRALRHRNPA